MPWVQTLRWHFWCTLRKPGLCHVYSWLTEVTGRRDRSAYTICFAWPKSILISIQTSRYHPTEPCTVSHEMVNTILVMAIECLYGIPITVSARAMLWTPGRTIGSTLCSIFPRSSPTTFQLYSHLAFLAPRYE